MPNDEVIDRTRALIETVLRGRAGGDTELIATCLHRDVHWDTPRSAPAGPYHGRAQVARALAGAATASVLDPSSLLVQVHRILADRDGGAVFYRLTGRTNDGGDYVNELCFRFEVIGDVITYIANYGDTYGVALAVGLEQFKILSEAAASAEPRAD